MKTQLTTLPGGLRVATCEMPHAETAAVGIWAGVGGRHESSKLNGISHFIEHMLFKGTKKRSARRIMEEVEGVGGDMNAYTSEERTCYYATAAAEYFPRICDVLCDLYVNPRFSQLDIDRERSVIGEEILMYRDEPSAHVQELLNESFWPSHPLGRPLTGTLSKIESFTREDFMRYRETHYHAKSTVLSAAGKIRHEDVVEFAVRKLADLPRGRSVKMIPAPGFPKGLQIVVEKRETQQTQVALAFPGPSHHEDSRFAFQLLHIILGGNASSRLFQQLREKRGLCYSVSTHPSFFEDTGSMNCSLGLDQRNLEKSLRLILTEITRLQTQLVGPAELRRAKEYSIGTSRMSLERSSSQNMRAGSSVLAYGRIVPPDEVHERLRRVTAEEVQEAAKIFLNPHAAALAVIGPSPDAHAIQTIFSV